MKKRVLNWFFGALGTLILIVLAFLGWLKWLISAFLILGSAVFGYLGFKILINSKEKSTHPWETSRVPLLLMLFGATTILLTLSILLMLDIIPISLE